VLPYEGTDVGLRLSAARDGDHYVLNGMKHFITNAGASKLYYVLARTDPSRGLRQGVTAFLVPTDTPGFRIGREHDKMGRRLQRNGELIFENARVPVGNRLGEEGRGHGLFTRFLRGGVTIPAAIAVGVARAAYQAAVAHAGTRVQGGRPLREHQTIANMLADMYGQIEAARTLVWRSAWAIDTDAPDASQLALMGKVVASEMAVRACISAMEVFGGYGYMRDLPMEKHVRDALSFLHSDGTNQMNRLRAARLL
jgi:alkylation response protein AidB-like acyl-CoA dehydrogenase